MIDSLTSVSVFFLGVGTLGVSSFFVSNDLLLVGWSLVLLLLEVIAHD